MFTGTRGRGRTRQINVAHTIEFLRQDDSKRQVLVEEATTDNVLSSNLCFVTEKRLTS